jgi:hypothetical protein
VSFHKKVLNNSKVKERKEIKMIDIKSILKRSWKILWNYKVLWIFGILLALTMGGGSGGSGNSGWRNQMPQSGAGSLRGLGANDFLPEGAPGWVNELVEWFVSDVEPLFLNPEQHIGTFIAIGVILLLVVVVFSVIAAFVRYPAETAVMRMVDGYEADGTKLGFKQGWKLGWNRRAFRLWLIDLILSLPVVLLISLMIGAGGHIHAAVWHFIRTWNRRHRRCNRAGLLIQSWWYSSVFLTVVRNFLRARCAGLTLRSFKYGWGCWRNWRRRADAAGHGWRRHRGWHCRLILFFLLIPRISSC